MIHPDCLKYERLYFQLLVFERYFETYNVIIRQEKTYDKQFYDHNYLSIVYFSGFILSSLAFLFDQNSEFSLVNTRFSVLEVEYKRRNLIKVWNKKKGSILEITQNLGILKYEEKSMINIAYHKLQKLDNEEVMDFMKAIVELYYLFEINYSIFSERGEKVKTKR